MKRMLINATQQEEIRVALVDGQQLYDLDIESKQRDRLKDSIYKGRIARIEPSLQAAFVEIGEGRQAFLPLKAVSPEHMKAEDLQLDQEKRNISSIFTAGQQILVQVEKEERGSKGAAVTSYISIAGRYVVLMPNNPRAGGISRRIEGEEREITRELLGQLDLPNGMGIIIRTGGVGRSVEELQWDLDHLLKLWTSISEAAEKSDTPALLFRDSDLMGRAIRDYLSPDIGEILVDDEQSFDAAREFVSQISPNLTNKVKRYEQKVPLFNYYQIESQIESAYRHRVSLPSGGSIVIERTEALVAIDVNSGRSTAGADIEETALNTNLEAVAEVARQLRLRDIGGIVVLDLIDMAPVRNRRQVEQAMEEALENDRARTQVQRISRFGLLEMTRERLGASLEETSTQLCPRCSGQGRIRDVPSTALSILRLSEEEALKRASTMVRARVPLEVASFLLNEKRSDLAEIEQRTQTHLVIVPTPHFETPHFEIERIRESDTDKATDVLSYQLMEPPPPVTTGNQSEGRRERRPSQPAVVAADRAPSPMPTGNADDSGLLTSLKKGLTSLFGSTQEKTPETPKTKAKKGSGQKQTQKAAKEKTTQRKSRNGQRARSQADKRDAPRKDKEGEKTQRRTRRQGSQKQTQSSENRQSRAEDQSKRSRQSRSAPEAKGRTKAAQEIEASTQAAESFTPPAEGQSKRKPRIPRDAKKSVREQATVSASPDSHTSSEGEASADAQGQVADTQPVQRPSRVARPLKAPAASEEKNIEISVEVSDIEEPSAEPTQAKDTRVEATGGAEAGPQRKATSRAPKRRPEVKAPTAPESFEIETTEVKPTESGRQAPAPRSPQNPSVRPANDPREGTQSATSKEFELEDL